MSDSEYNIAYPWCVVIDLGPEQDEWVEYTQHATQELAQVEVDRAAADGGLKARVAKRLPDGTLTFDF